jgi:hypothetical protein
METIIKKDQKTIATQLADSIASFDIMSCRPINREWGVLYSR